MGFLFCKQTRHLHRVDVDQRNNLKFITNNGEHPRFSPDGSRIYVTTGGYCFRSARQIARSCDLNGKDEKE